MAAPLSPDGLVNALRSEGCRVVTVDEWRTHNRNHKGPWGPVHGVMVHHTVSSGENSSVDLCYNGYSGLPGPLCQGVIGKSGTIYIISAGRSNHAGGGDPDVFAAVKAENYGDRPPAPNVGNSDGMDGNAHFYGWECVNLGDGKDPWPDAQVDAIVRASAAVCRAYGWTSKSVIGHKEWSDDKSDPRGPGSVVDMPVLRAKIAERLSHDAGWSPGTTAPPTNGAPVSIPNRTHLHRPENLTLLDGIPQTIYWTQEYQDDAQGHGAGGKTVGSNLRYVGEILATVSGLQTNEVIEFYPAEEDSSGNRMGNGEPVQVVGRAEGFHPVRVAVPVVGTVTNRLVFDVVSRTSMPVTLEDVQVKLMSWPNA